MGWLSDLLYPDNPKRRAKVQDYVIKIKSSLETMTNDVNDVVDEINKVLKNTISKVEHYKDEENLSNFFNKLIKKLDEIESTANSAIDEDISIDTKVYQEVRDSIKGGRLDDTDKLVDRLSKASSSLNAFIVALSGVSAKILAKTVFSASSRLVAAFGGTLGGVLLGLLVEVIVEAIMGAVERKELEDKIKELEDAFEVLKGARDDLHEVTSDAKADIRAAIKHWKK